MKIYHIDKHLIHIKTNKFGLWLESTNNTDHSLPYKILKQTKILKNGANFSEIITFSKVMRKINNSQNPNFNKTFHFSLSQSLTLDRKWKKKGKINCYSKQTIVSCNCKQNAKLYFVAMFLKKEVISKRQSISIYALCEQCISNSNMQCFPLVINHWYTKRRDTSKWLCNTFKNLF